MDATLNPFTPGSGRKPLVLEGRDDDLEAFNALISRAANDLPVERPLLLTGLRGVGKTVLLAEMFQRAEDHGWATVKFETARGEKGRMKARNALGKGLAKASLRYRTRTSTESARQMLATVTSFQLSIGIEAIAVGVERDLSRASTQNLELDLLDTIVDMTTALKADHVGLAVFVDEMQDLDEEVMRALLTAQHEATQRDLPFYLIGAGLPNLQPSLVDASSYAERMFNSRIIDRLTSEEARRAFRRPLERMALSIDEEALEILVDASGAYPYFIQEYGSALWSVAEHGPFTAEDAKRACQRGLRILDTTFFATRWARATPAERTYMWHMSTDGDVWTRTAQIAERMDRSASSLGPTRASLISKGLVYVPKRGLVAFTVPSFADFIKRTDTEDLLDTD